eukprot:CAMPEP_0171485924 /NCGR_PEP_ID=MMETSP0958-20121227/808_1 /TAXON_ID=87120 /ORGANISM="Aurantiochytrium limacinum, Strain ATCCMYA-1381" /LENGTH=1126 /DNA_ID=CAMNT_0012018753 /DNA_START=176 /DNA_END=3556 /DNA_ORIENTATION=-
MARSRKQMCRKQSTGARKLATIVLAVLAVVLVTPSGASSSPAQQQSSAMMHKTTLYTSPLAAEADENLGNREKHMNKRLRSAQRTPSIEPAPRNKKLQKTHRNLWKFSKGEEVSNSEMWDFGDEQGHAEWEEASLQNVQSFARRTAGTNDTNTTETNQDSSRRKITLSMLTGLTLYNDTGVRKSIGMVLTSKVSAMVIATQHCQERNDIVIPELGAQYMQGCENMDFDLTSYDTLSVQSGSVKAYLSGLMREDKPTNFVIGTSRSVTSLPISVLANVNKVPIISYWASSPDFDDNGVHEQFLRTIPADSAIANAVSDLLLEYNLEHAALLYVDDSYGDGYRESLVKETATHDIDVQTFSYEEGDVDSIKYAVSSAKSTGFNAIIVIAFTGDFEAILRNLHAHDMIGEGKLLVVGDGIGSHELTTIIQANPTLAPAFNATQAVLAISGDDSNPVFQRLHTNWPSFIKYMDTINDYLPSGKHFSTPTETNGYLDGVDNMTIQIDETMFDRDNAESFIYDAAYAYDAVAAACRATCESYRKAGYPEETNSTSGAPTFDGIDERPYWLRGDALVDILRNRSQFPFQGASGRVEFDEYTGSRVPETAYYKLRNFIVDPDDLSVSVVDVGSWNISWTIGPRTLFPGGTTVIPLQVDPPIEIENLIGKEYRIVANTVVAMVFCICIALAVWVFINRRTHVVRKSQPEFLFIFLFGICMAISSVIAYTYPDTQASGDASAGVACNAFLWLLSLGTTTTATAIILKLYRIMRIFHNPSLRLLLITASSLFKVLATVLIINIILLIVPSVIDPMTWKRIVVVEDNFGNPAVSYATCYFSDSLVVKSCMWLLLAFHVSFYFIGATIAYRVRDVDSSFQEGKSLAVAVMWQFQLYLIAAPIILAVSATETRTKFIIICLAIVLANMFALVFVMGPKVHAVWHAKSHPPQGRGSPNQGRPQNHYIHKYSPRRGEAKEHDARVQSSRHSSKPNTVHNLDTPESLLEDQHHNSGTDSSSLTRDEAQILLGEARSLQFHNQNHLAESSSYDAEENSTNRLLNNPIVPRTSLQINRNLNTHHRSDDGDCSSHQGQLHSDHGASTSLSRSNEMLDDFENDDEHSQTHDPDHGWTMPNEARINIA